MFSDQCADSKRAAGWTAMSGAYYVVVDCVYVPHLVRVLLIFLPFEETWSCVLGDEGRATAVTRGPINKVMGDTVQGQS